MRAILLLLATAAAFAQPYYPAQPTGITVNWGEAVDPPPPSSMAFLARIVHFTLSSTASVTDTIDITDPDLGTIDGGIIFLTGATALGTPRQNAVVGIGAFEGTTAEDSMTADAEGQQAEMDTARKQTNGKVISMLDGTGTLDVELSVSSLITGGVRLVYDDVPSQNWRGFALLMEGAEELKVDDSTNLDNGTYSGMSGYPDLVFVFGTTGSTSVSTGGKLSMGIACRDPSDNSIQGQIGFGAEAKDADSKVELYLGVDTGSILKRGSGPSWYETYVLSSFTSTGYSYTNVTRNLGSVRQVAVRLPSGQQALCGVQNWDTDTGADTITIDYASGDDDSELLFLFGTALTADAGATPSKDDWWAIGTADADGNVGALGWQDDQGNATTQSESYCSNTEVFHGEIGSGAVEKSISLTNLTGGTASLNIDTNAGNAEYFGWFAIQAGAGGGGPSGPPVGGMLTLGAGG